MNAIFEIKQNENINILSLKLIRRKLMSSGANRRELRENKSYDGWKYTKKDLTKKKEQAKKNRKVAKKQRVKLKK